MCQGIARKFHWWVHRRMSHAIGRRGQLIQLLKHFGTTIVLQVAQHIVDVVPPPGKVRCSRCRNTFGASHHVGAASSWPGTCWPSDFRTCFGWFLLCVVRGVCGVCVCVVCVCVCLCVGCVCVWCMWCVCVFALLWLLHFFFLLSAFGFFILSIDVGSFVSFYFLSSAPSSNYIKIHIRKHQQQQQQLKNRRSNAHINSKKRRFGFKRNRNTSHPFSFHTYFRRFGFKTNPKYVTSMFVLHLFP